VEFARPADADPAHVVRGRVTEGDEPAAGAVVTVLRRELRALTEIDHTSTDADGRYTLRVPLDPPDLVSGPRAELVVRAAPDGAPERQAEVTLVVRNPGGDLDADHAVDVALPVTARSEWEQLAVLVPPLLGQRGDRAAVQAAELNDADADYLSAVTGLGRELIGTWAAAARSLRDDWAAPRGERDDVAAGDLADAGAALPRLLFALHRAGTAEPADVLLRRTTPDLLDVLARAAQEGVVPAPTAEDLEALRGQLDARRVELALRTSPDDRVGTLGDALRMMPRAAALQLDNPDGPGRKVTALVLSAPAAPPWDAIREIVADDDLLADVRRGVGLLQLTGGYLPLMRALRDSRGPGDAATLTDLVSLDEGDWVRLVRQNGAPPGGAGDGGRRAVAQRQRRYAHGLARAVELLHPVPFVALRIADGRIPVAAEARAPLGAFLAANAGFRLGERPVLDLLAAADLDTGGLDGDQLKAIAPELLTLERITRVAPLLGHVGGLLASGFASARDIVLSHSRDVFIEQIRPVIADAQDAGLAYDAAAAVVAATEGLIFARSPLFTGAELPVLAPYQPFGVPVFGATAGEAAGTPIAPANLAGLFGSQDYSECATGASLFGPAAYLADLLQMLARGPHVNGRTALQVLLDRRPDIAELDLSGDNADMTMAYIDLVLEQLEMPDWEAGLGFRVLRGGTPQVPDDSYDAALDSGEVPAALAADIGTWELPLGEQRTVVRGANVTNRAGAVFPSWLVRDQLSGMKLRLLGAQWGVYRIRAYPQSAAGMESGYRPWPRLLSATANAVATARFPWSLPFDVTRDEANAWLAYLGAPRERVVLAFTAGARWRSADAAAEALGLGPAPRDILLSPPSAAAPGYRDWGFANASVGAEGITDPIAGLTGQFDAASGTVRWPGPAGVRADPAAWDALLKNVSLLRARAGLTHRELLAVLETRFVRAGGPRLDITGDEADPALMRLEAMDPALARRIHLFVRLWRRTGWAANDLDRAIAASPGHTAGVAGSVRFTPAFLLFAANVTRLNAAAGTPVADLIDLFAGSALDTFRYWDHTGRQPVLSISRYEYWFDNPALGRPRLPELQLDAAGTGLTAGPRPADGLPRPRLSDHRTYLAGAVGLSERELAALLPAAVVSVPPAAIGAAPVTGDPVDLRGAAPVTVEIVTGALGAGVQVTVTAEHAGADGVFAAVDPAELGGANPVVLGPGAPPVTWVSYTGTGTLLRTRLTASGAGAWATTRVLTDAGAVTDELSLATLTAVCRYSILRRTLDRPVAELRTLALLSGIDPLAGGATPDLALDLLDARDALDTLGLTPTAADALLRGPEGAAAADLDSYAEAFLDAVRTAAVAVRSESTVAADQRPALLTTVLTGARWDPSFVSRVLGADELSTVLPDYAAALAAPPALPGGGALPAPLRYDEANGILGAPVGTRPAVLRGVLGPLIAGAADAALRAALQALDDEAAGRDGILASVQADLRAAGPPTLRVPVAVPAAVTVVLPAEWQGRLFHDRATGELCLVGWLSPAEAAALKALPGLPVTVVAAIEALRLAALAYVPPAADVLVVREGTAGLTAETLMLDTAGLPERCGLLLDQLLPRWRQARLQARVAVALGQSAGCAPEVATALLALRDAGTGRALADVAAADELLASDPATRPTRDAFPGPFDAAARLIRLAGLASALSLSPAEVPWLGGPWTGLDLTAVPVSRAAGPAAGGWRALTALASLFAVRGRLPGRAAALAEVIAATAAPDVDGARLAAALGSDVPALRAIGGPEGPGPVDSAWVRDPANLLRLASCLALARALNVPAEVLVGARRGQDAGRPVADAESEVRALRAASLNGDAAARETVLDGIRTRRRDATVDYLVQARGLRDADDLYGQLLIDPKMGPCTQTSRLVQAISAVQLFIQRCLLRLEPDALPDAINADHWAWMKNYRVWEANRQVLLYPENWIDPELRDDRTPFFDDLVSALRQGDATSDAAEAAVRRFCEQLTDFSRMEIAGLCSDYDEQNRLVTTNVFGRTRSEPRAYFHRQFRKLDPAARDSPLGVWTPWQALSLDIQSDHLIPLSWAGRTFLFWATFSKEADDPTAAELQQGQSSPAPPRKLWRLKLAWSELKSGRWTPRRIAQDELVYGPLYAAKQVQNAQNAAATSDWFLFLTAGNDEGATIAAFWLNDRETFYDPLTVMFFDGDRVISAPGTYEYDGAQRTWRLVQTAGQHAEAPVDSIEPRKPRNHYRMAIGSNAGDPVTLNHGAADPLVTLSTPPLNYYMLFPPATAFEPFAAPPPDPAEPIDAAQRTMPCVFSDRLHTFFVYPVVRQASSGTARLVNLTALDWPQADPVRRILDRQGIGGLLSPLIQQRPLQNYFTTYGPRGEAVAAAPDGDLEFALSSASSVYNFELFFHAPFAIACALHQNQRFEEARQWFHYVFDPTDASADPSPARYWRFRPFRELQDVPLPELLRRLADPADHSPEKLEFQSAIADWKDRPFRPHAVARMRLRSYMYAVVMKYLDNLLDWADQLFRRDTTESDNEAAQLYILAAQILGRRPESIPRRTRPVLRAFTELAAGHPDDLSNALVDAENLIPAQSGSGSPAPPNLPTLYFCVPRNERLDDYYDRVADRLFKLRNCMNIDGVERQVALFAPPVDPALLVRAAAAGVDLGAVLADASAPLPHQRFTVAAAKANEVLAEVKALGGALLTALEKGDAEALALTHAEQEAELQRQVRALKEKQLLDAKAGMDVLGASLASATAKYTHYTGLLAQLAPLSVPTGPVTGPTLERLGAAALDVAVTATELSASVTGLVDPLSATALDTVKKVLSRASDALAAGVPADSMATAMVPMNPAEQARLTELKSAHDLQEKAADQRLVAQFLAMIPDFTLGAQGFASSPVVQLQIGGTLLSKVANFAASITDSKAAEHTYRAGLHETLGSYQRRAEDWTLQAQLAVLDLAEIGEQLKAAVLKVAIASQELADHDLETAQSAARLDLLRAKFTNADLYSWMSGRLAALYFDTYQLAYDAAKRAERCFAAELGVDVTFLKFGYWDSLRKGLLAADALSADVKRMELAYLAQSAREYEITKRVSLRELDPRALVTLRETGECEFTVPEVLYTLDFPGHYYRRIKAVSVSVPCVVGPYTSLSGTLTLLSSRIRVRSEPARAGYDDDENFRVSAVPAQAIATSTGQDDSGMFELNFRDERYLPFEGAGADSRWRFKLPATFRAFDYATITDLVLTVRYTAREGGSLLRAAAEQSLTDAVNAIVADHGEQGFARLVSLAEEFPGQWRRLLTEAGPDGAATQAFPLPRGMFPYLAGRRTITVGTVDVLGLPAKPGAAPAIGGLQVTLPGAANPVAMTTGDSIGRLRSRTFAAALVVADDEDQAQWQLTVPAAALEEFRATVGDLVLLCHYTFSADPDA
jgi:hypothetical protein